jgi:hypothetical protein
VGVSYAPFVFPRSAVELPARNSIIIDWFSSGMARAQAPARFLPIEASWTRGEPLPQIPGGTVPHRRASLDGRARGAHKALDTIPTVQSR